MRWVAGFIVVLALLLAARWAVLRFALTPDCSNDVIAETPSPGGGYVAVVFDRDCGATTSNERIVMLRRSKEKLKPNDYGEWIFTAKHKPRVEIKWADATHVVIRSDSNDESPKPPAQWHDVSIVREYSR